MQILQIFLPLLLPIFSRLVLGCRHRYQPLWQSGAGLPSNHASPQGCIATRKISTLCSLVTISQSCILPVHSIRRLDKLPNKKDGKKNGKSRRPSTSGRTIDA
jgi:hypothetical protein